jgi:phosphoribosylaminoimidazole-succinocarboxamide synthase
MNKKAILETDLPGIPLLYKGKVRKMYDLGECLLMVVTDNISAFDVVMNEPIPDKGKVLTQTSLFWFDYLSGIVPNHLITADVDEFPEVCWQYRDLLRGRSMLVKKAEPLTVGCIVRGYISGSFWKAYRKNSVVCGFELPNGLQESEKLPQTLFTPSTKAALGTHDENISLERMREIIGVAETDKIADICLRLYERAANYARMRGIIIADTKFELGWYKGELILIDEVLTPDSSRFWPVDGYEIGHGQPSFDKQFLRDYLLSIGYDGNSPAPPLPADIITKTQDRYQDCCLLLTGDYAE